MAAKIIILQISLYGLATLNTWQIAKYLKKCLIHHDNNLEITISKTIVFFLGRIVYVCIPYMGW